MNPKPETLKMLEDEMSALNKLYPSAQLPPNCFSFMQADFVDYESRQMLKVKMPVLKESLNPVGVMQGGFITAAFDNTFGPLSYLAARFPCTTLELHTNYIRSVREGDYLIIEARVVYRTNQAMHLEGRAFSEKGKLVATSTSHMIIMKGQ